VSLDHEGKVEESGEGEVELTDGRAKDDTGDDGCSRGTEPSSKGDGVCALDGEVRGEEGDGVRAEDVEGGSGDEVLEGVERDAFGSFAGVGERGVGGV
jgi:hypothetical protein